MNWSVWSEERFVLAMSYMSEPTALPTSVPNTGIGTTLCPMAAKTADVYHG
jgi:hypothetical protein